MGEHADEAAAERAADRHRDARAFDDTDLLARVDHDVGRHGRAEHADGRRDDHALRNVEQFAVVSRPHGRAPPRVSTASGTAMPKTETSGTVRLATPAIIDPCPTSRNMLAPS